MAGMRQRLVGTDARLLHALLLLVVAGLLAMHGLSGSHATMAGAGAAALPPSHGAHFEGTVGVELGDAPPMGSSAVMTSASTDLRGPHALGWGPAARVASAGLDQAVAVAAVVVGAVAWPQGHDGPVMAMCVFVLTGSVLLLLALLLAARARAGRWWWSVVEAARRGPVVGGSRRPPALSLSQLGVLRT